MAAVKNTLVKLLDHVGSFVIKQKGSWNHADWEAFLGDVEKMGFPLDDETKRRVGNLLEESKELYGKMPAAPAKKKAAAKKKPAAKKKAAAKKK